MRVLQINLQTYFGGGEVYTAFLCRALSALGVSTTLICHERASFWSGLGLPADTVLLPVGSGDALPASLPADIPWILSHGPLSEELAGRLAADNRLLTGVAHMPVQDRNPGGFGAYGMVFPVSEWVRQGLLQKGLSAWSEPLYGVPHLARPASAGPLRRNSSYDWDKRKFRDRFLSRLEPLASPLLPRPTYSRRPGLTLGIVSRLTPIKQFPLLFSKLAPVLTRFPRVNLEIFGSGGYASVRDLKRALAPIRGQVRFWGQQQDVAAIYRELDYLVTGLPEKEALGLNVIEAQACGTPVLAVGAPPFTETVLEGRTGFFYRDPREDEGADFADLLGRLFALPRAPDPREAREHLARFGFEAFVERLRKVVAWAGEAQTRT